jgi:Photosynthetic reaction centre cytochrome C subunit
LDGPYADALKRRAEMPNHRQIAVVRATRCKTHTSAGGRSRRFAILTRPKAADRGRLQSATDVARARRGVMRPVLVLAIALIGGAPMVRAGQEPPKAELMEGPAIKVLTGLTVPQFDAEMKFIVQALGVSCAYCHVRNNFASDENTHKIAARRMLEMTRAINQQFYPDFTPGYDESRVGRITCYTCHQGSLEPKNPTGGGN